MQAVVGLVCIVSAIGSASRVFEPCVDPWCTRAAVHQGPAVY